MERVLIKTGVDQDMIHTAMEDIITHSRKRTDINDHLATLFFHSLQARPKLIVELGVRGGESTFVLVRTAACCDSTLVSADISDCSHACEYDKWFFVKKDDTAFAGEFPVWCRGKGIKQGIDLLFIDTSHLYEHTVAEIKSWFPLLSEHATVMFHDTNLKAFFKRRDGSMGVGWNNHRGVIRSIEEYFKTQFDEVQDFSARIAEWEITHYSLCNGLTVLRR